ncbi:MAG: hypothetical protein HY711_03710 [Candidatus Melainabacteria bacterium]|nr:hypothetical protein [Candidatus Melainabacteria bacterium]
MAACRTSLARLRLKGQQAAEFAGAITILVLCIFLPLMDLVVVPVRVGLATASVNSYVRELSRLDRLSQAFEMLDTDPRWKTSLARLGGVSAKTARLSLVVDSIDELGMHANLDGPRAVPAEWLPDGAHCPCNFMLSLQVHAEIFPLVTVPIGGVHVPGLNAPFQVVLNSQAAWENLGRNPATQEYFLNE